MSGRCKDRKLSFSNKGKKQSGRAWWRRPVFPVTLRLRLENPKFKTSFSNLVGPCLKKINEKGWGCGSVVVVKCPWVKSPVPRRKKKFF